MNTSRKGICSAAVLALALVAATSAAAQTAAPDSAAKAAASDSTTSPHSTTSPNQLPSLYNKWEISPTAAAVILGADIRIDASNGGFGTTINAQDDLGLAKTKMQPRIDARLRFGRKHELEGGFQFSERSGAKTTQRQLNFADTTFNVGASLDSKLTTNLLFLNYRYAIIAKDRTQAGVGVGLGALFFKTKLDVAANAGGGGVGYSASKSVTAPVGSLGLYGRYLIGSRWSAETDARLVKLRVDRFHIRYAELNAAGRYWFSRKWGAELGGSGDWVKVQADPRFRVGDANYGPSYDIKFSLANVRIGAVFVP
jgi:hypothetical protein